ncbi:hypothetical protein ASG87_02635 [Frateuria sp. Soil773]|uniref:cytochrome oxidase putative small subunit CydP n=1 Tax=Frateuria sp. Soil773 TaxID=1736407 RepID=UPI0006F7AB0F|nr:cytochrome oxidase putative small subunit CydP [Frateuria sp. Soil773]KRE89865.1 hypothetical protein ASG87_02635 [Frateuria sp. Soil773]
MSQSPAETPAVPLPRRPLRRLGVELVLLVVAKIALLTLIWWVAIAPHPKPDTRPAAIERLLAPAPTASQGSP